jgi:acetylornithine deacetylase/succinyl-diaminopimelate desuccinylase-like protein
MSILDTALNHAREQRDAHLDELKTLLAIPSVSTLPEHKEDVARTAEWLAQHLRALGMTRVDIMPTPGHPVVYAEWLSAADKPTVLAYGHYDVQPVDPLDEWISDPWGSEIRGENLHARGASDMKGQLFAFLKALESLRQDGAWPVNLKILFEGEEEIGSEHLDQFLVDNKDLLKSDIVLNCDGGIHAADQPSIVYSLRGLAYFELEVRGPEKDLHSGLFGGTLLNPAQALCELVAGMHDADGRVTLPGFYDDVRPLTDYERGLAEKVPHSDDDWKGMAGVDTLWGEAGYTTVERIGARPTLEINGIVGGFTGEGSKTVLPARAMAKISMRLVADQKPEAIAGYLRAYLEQNAPEAVSWELRELVHGPGAIMELDSTAMKAAVGALETVFGKEPVFKREGGSVPVVGLMQDLLGVDTVMLGFGLPDDGIHGPNEKLHLPTFYRGVETYIHFLAAL